MRSVYIRDDEDSEIEQIPSALDAFSMNEGSVTVIHDDESREKRNGRLFGARGKWKLWVEQNGKMREIGAVETPMEQPSGAVAWDVPSKLHRNATHGRIKRVKAL